jgi:glucan phosphoethanolaminetransferase (alkaline phosphatase superfamily)
MFEKIILNNGKIKNSPKAQYIIYCVMFFILLIPNIFTLFYAADLTGNPVMMISYFVLSVLVWLLPLLVLNFKNFFRLGILFFLLSPIEIGFVKSTGLPINIGLMESVLHTNFQEAREQLWSNFPILSFLIILLIFYCFLLSFINKFKLPFKGKISLILVFVLLNSVLFAKMFSILETYIPLNGRMQVAYEITTKKYNKIFPINIISNTFAAIKNDNINKKFETEIEKFSFNGKPISKNQENEIYVLVIGETTRRANFHLYGYPRETTPQLEKTKNLTPFSNVNSSANLTLFSLPQIITRSDPDHFNVQYKEKTILDVFHEANYYTALIGAQNMSTPILKRLHSVSDYSFSAKSDISSSQFYDGDILKNVKEIINDKTHRKKFIIIHSLGSHFRYSNRYPQGFEKFKPNISRSGYSNMSLEYKQELINSYDNSILYTDYFLASLIKEIDKANVISGLIYLSDHGENLYDDGKTIFHGGEKPTHFEYEIPYLVWNSQKYRDFYPEKMKALESNKNKKGSSTATFYSLSDMANLSYKNSNAEMNKSFFSIKYKELKERKILTSTKEVLIVK